MATHEFNPDDYDFNTFVDHPRFGRGPRYTGLNPDPRDPDVSFHWHATTYNDLKRKYGDTLKNIFRHGFIYTLERLARDRPQVVRIPDTAIQADPGRQRPATIQVTHYFDLIIRCVDCDRLFIFFAAEQRHWYEELGFKLDAGCVRCVECRKKQQNLDRSRQTYETLIHVEDRDSEQCLDMAEACLALIEEGVFNTRRTETVRMLFNSVPEDSPLRDGRRFVDLHKRLLAIEAESER